MGILAMLYDQTWRNQKWKIQDGGVALNLKYVYLSLYTRWQRNPHGYTYVFGFQLTNGNTGNVVQTNGKEPEVQIPRWRPENFEYV